MVGTTTNIGERARIIALREEGVQIKEIAARVGHHRATVSRILAASRTIDNHVPLPKPRLGKKKKTSDRTDALIKRCVMINPFISSVEIKKDYPELLNNVSERTIRDRLHRDMNLRAHRAARKPALTKLMINKRLKFCKKYKDWTPEQWKKVVFSDESTFRCVRLSARTVRRPPKSNRYDPRYTIKTVKHPPSLMVWGAFSGDQGAGELYFLDPKQTMNGEIYLDVLKDHMHSFFDLHQPDGVFLHDGAPPHKCKDVKQWLRENCVPEIEWPGNSPDLNPIENVWSLMKSELKGKDTSTVERLKETILQLWRGIDSSYFDKLATSMPRRIQAVINAHGDNTKY